jgi:hypothetical protein
MSQFVSKRSTVKKRPTNLSLVSKLPSDRAEAKASSRSKRQHKEPRQVVVVNKIDENLLSDLKR